MASVAAEALALQRLLPNGVQLLVARVKQQGPSVEKVPKGLLLCCCDLKVGVSDGLPVAHDVKRVGGRGRPWSSSSDVKGGCFSS